jgi:hypothetical protein
MGITYWRVELGPDGPLIEGTGVTLDSFLDGLVRVVFASDASDLDRVASGDLVVDLTGVARSATAIRHLAENLDSSGAAGLLTHGGRVDGNVLEEPSTGPFPVLLIKSDIPWEEVLQPLLNLDAMLRSGGAAAGARSTFLSELLDEPSEALLSATAVRAGLNIDMPYRALVVEPGRATRDLDARLEQVASIEAVEVTSQISVTTVGGHIAVLHPDIQSGTDLPVRLLAAAQSVGLVDAYIGVGGACMGARAMKTSYREARWAAAFARRMEVPDRIGRFDEMRLDAWVAAIDGDLGASATGAVDALAAHDSLQGSELVQTLWVYLMSRHAQDAAARLYLHRNTLRYRMDLIKRVTGLDPRDPNDRVMLHLQARLAAMRGKITPRALENPR